MGRTQDNYGDVILYILVAVVGIPIVIAMACVGRYFSSNESGYIFALVLSAVALVGGGMGFYYTNIQKAHLNQLQPATGHIEGGSYIDHKETRNGSTSHTYSVRYSYTVGTQTYTNSADTATDPGDSGDVGVFYDPTHPDVSILDRSGQLAGNFGFNAFAIIVMIGSVPMALMAWRTHAWS